MTLDLRPEAGGPRRMTDKSFLEREITAWLRSEERRRQLEGEAYYAGGQAVLSRRRTALDEGGRPVPLDRLPASRLVNNQYAKLVDQKTNYSFGRPFSLDGEDRDHARAVNGVLGARFRRLLRAVGEGAWTGGLCWLHPCYRAGELAFRRFPAHEVLPFWADGDHTELDAAVRLYAVQEYGSDGRPHEVVKAEVLHGGGADCFTRREDGLLVPEGSAPYITRGEAAYNWTRLPLICFKSSHRELPLLSRVKCLQDAYNQVLSAFADRMEEDINSTVLVLKNYDGEDLAQFRTNLAALGVVKVRSYEGCEGGVDTLRLEVDGENYRLLLSLLKDAIIENARGYDARDQRLSGSPNQMNIQSMYSDIDLDANGIELEFQAAMEEVLWFVDRHLANTGGGSPDHGPLRVIFDRDVLINETEAVNNCRSSVGILSNETIVKMHPWVSDPEQELERLRAEQAAADPYRAAFEGARVTHAGA